MPSVPAPIEIRDLTKRYGRRIGVERLSLQVPPATIYGFLGPNGSGKTTAIRVLMGLMRPTEGAARVLDRNCWRESARIRAEVGYLPGDVRLYPWMTCRSGLAIAAAARARDIVRDGMQLADRFELDAEVPVQSMSRGMRQKLGLILALAHSPRLLILDEPTASLDPIMQSRLYDDLRRRASQGCTVFLSSHTLSEVEELCDRVAILRRGRLVSEDTIDNLRRRASRVVTILWRADVDGRSLAPPPELTLVRNSNSHWEGHLQGPAADFVRWCATQPIADVTINSPDLARVFRQFYE